MEKPTASTLFRLGLSAASRQWGLVLPLVMVEAAVALLALVPLIFVAAHVYARISRVPLENQALATFFGAFESILDPALWVVAIVGALLVGAGAWLARTLVFAGAAGGLADQVGHPRRVESDGFARGILEAPERWLVAGLAAGVLRLVALLSGLGAVVAGMAHFVANPGPLAALVMTTATFMLLAVPLLTAALEVGFVRSVLRKDPPLVSLGEGVLLAFRHARAVLPIWYGLAFANVAVGISHAIAVGNLAVLPSQGSLWILNLGPRALVWLVFSGLFALVTLMRLGTYAALLAWDAGDVPLKSEPIAPPSPPPLAGLPPPLPAGPGGEI